MTDVTNLKSSIPKNLNTDVAQKLAEIEKRNWKFNVEQKDKCKIALFAILIILTNNKLQSPIS